MLGRLTFAGAALLGLWLGMLWAGNRVVIQRVPISLPHIEAQISGSDAVAMAEGTWIIENEASAFPLQTSKILCTKHSKTCQEIRAEISSVSDQVRFLVVQRDTYEIAEWSSSQVTYTGDFECVSYLYTLNFANKSATGIRRPKANRPAQCEQKELRLRLTGGLDVTRKLQMEARPWYLKLATFWL